jgi:hypothetical protein
MDVISQALQAFGYLLLLVVLTMLWIKASRQPELRRFWILFALAWTMNLFGNIAWIVHDFVTRTPLASFSIIDIFYVSHYVLIALALWQYPASMPRRAWLWIGAAMLVVNALVWGIYFRPAMIINGGSWVNFLGLAMYPVLDAGLITLAWLRYGKSRRSSWTRLTFLLFCAMMSYGIANTLNLTGTVFPPMANGVFPNLFWILKDVFMLALIWGAPNGLSGFSIRETR